MDDAIADLLRAAPAPDERARAEVADRARRVLRPAGALSRLDEVAAWIAGWQRTARPRIERSVAIVFVAAHGVTGENVSAYPPEVTAAMLDALIDGDATAAAFARSVGASLRVVDAGVKEPSGNIARGPALAPEHCAAALEAGRAAVRDSDADLIVCGDMGIGNTTAAAALSATLFGLRAEDWTGRGTGVDEAGLARKIAVVDAARRRARGPGDGALRPLQALREVGGSDLAAIAGAVLEARLRSVPVILDGFVVTAAAATLELLVPGALDHCIAGHRSPEPGHGMLLEKLGKEPLLDLEMRLGEGTGALAAIPLVRLAIAGVIDVATFAERGLE